MTQAASVLGSFVFFFQWKDQNAACDPHPEVAVSFDKYAVFSCQQKDIHEVDLFSDHTFVYSCFKNFSFIYKSDSKLNFKYFEHLLKAGEKKNTLKVAVFTGSINIVFILGAVLVIVGRILLISANTLIKRQFKGSLGKRSWNFSIFTKMFFSAMSYSWSSYSAMIQILTVSLKSSLHVLLFLST